MVNEYDLDPATLRAIAQTTDERAEFYRGQCPCHLHLGLMNYSLLLSADLRTRAIRIEQAREAARRTARDAPGYTVEQVPRTEVLRGTRGSRLPPGPLPGHRLDGHAGALVAETGSAVTAAAEHQRNEALLRGLGASVERYRLLLRTTELTPDQAYRQAMRDAFLADEP